MSDLIERQAVLDVVYESRKNFNNEFDQGFFADKIKDLPSVNLQEPCDDLCKSCDTKECIFQSGIHRTECDFYKSAQGFMSIEPQQEDIAKDGTLTVRVADGRKVTRVLVCGDNHFGGLYYPDEDAEPKWIPVSERLPEDMCHVWITCISKVDDREPWVCDGFYNPYYHGTKYSKWGNIPMLNWGDAEVIAWMEQDIPEPYKESEDKE